MEFLTPAVTRHLDELDAGQLGDAFLHEQAARFKGKEIALRRVPQPDNGQAALPFKGVALMDAQDRMLAVYLLNRDALNWTRLTLISMPEV